MAADGPTWLVENASGFPETMIAMGELPMEVDADKTEEAGEKASRRGTKKDGEGGTGTKRKAKDTTD